jgi:hypothetical protein
MPILYAYASGFSVVSSTNVMVCRRTCEVGSTNMFESVSLTTESTEATEEILTTKSTNNTKSKQK